MKREILQTIRELATEISKETIEIYNEASIQYELAIILRERLGTNYKIQLEKNIKDFGISKMEKKEMDIVLFSPDKNEKYCIELKFPTNGQYPEQMFSACKDVRFLEQLKAAGFNGGFFIMFAKDAAFYSGNKEDGIYKMFRKDKIIKGKVKKPTGSKKGEMKIGGAYPIQWQALKGDLKYFVIAV